MSKISEYLEAIALRRANESFQTVADFAKDLNKPPDVLLEQLRGAGVSKASDEDQMTEKDKELFLKHLQKAHLPKGRRKKITLTIESEAQRLFRAAARKDNGAEWDCLKTFTDTLLIGGDIDPDLQRLVNLIVAKAFVSQALPMKKRGRPKSDELEELGRKVAQDYWDMRDKGMGYSEAVTRLVDLVHKDERHIMRLIEKHKASIGLTLEERRKKREWAATLARMYSESGRDPLQFYRNLSLKTDPEPDFAFEDYVDHFDELIRQESEARKPLTKKI